MKKIIKCLLFIICMFNILIVFNSHAEMIGINDFDIDVRNELAQSKTDLILSWTINQEIDEFKIYTTLTNGQKELSYIYSYNSGRDNIGNLEVTLNENGKYEYIVEFQIDVIRTGNLNIEMIYTIGDEKYEYRNYIMTKGDVVDAKSFTKGKAILVGLIITLFVVIGSLLIFESSKTEYELNDDTLTIKKIRKG